MEKMVLAAVSARIGMGWRCGVDVKRTLHPSLEIIFHRCLLTSSYSCNRATAGNRFEKAMAAPASFKTDRYHLRNQTNLFRQNTRSAFPCFQLFLGTVFAIADPPPPQTSHSKHTANCSCDHSSSTGLHASSWATLSSYLFFLHFPP